MTPYYQDALVTLYNADALRSLVPSSQETVDQEASDGA